MSRVRSAALAALVCGALAEPGAALDADRELRFVYSVEIGPVPAGEGPVHVFVPLPRDDASQDVLERRITTSIPGEVGHERAHGNSF